MASEKGLAYQLTRPTMSLLPLGCPSSPPAASSTSSRCPSSCSLFLSGLPELSRSGRGARGDRPRPSGQAQCEAPAAHQGLRAAPGLALPRAQARAGEGGGARRDVRGRGTRARRVPGRPRGRGRGGSREGGLAQSRTAPSQLAARGRRASRPQLPPTAPGRANPQRTFHSSGATGSCQFPPLVRPSGAAPLTGARLAAKSWSGKRQTSALRRPIPDGRPPGEAARGTVTGAGSGEPT